jgi:hypothetical protein
LLRELLTWCSVVERVTGIEQHYQLGKSVALLARHLLIRYLRGS